LKLVSLLESCLLHCVFPFEPFVSVRLGYKPTAYVANDHCIIMLPFGYYVGQGALCASLRNTKYLCMPLSRSKPSIASYSLHYCAHGKDKLQRINSPANSIIFFRPFLCIGIQVLFFLVGWLVYVTSHPIYKYICENILGKFEIRNDTKKIQKTNRIPTISQTSLNDPRRCILCCEDNYKQ